MLEIYKKNNLMSEYSEAVSLLKGIENKYGDLSNFSPDIIDSVVEEMIINKANTVDNFVVLMRYYRAVKLDDLFIYLTQYTGMIDVLESILKRTKQLIGDERYKKVFNGFTVPVLGTSPKKLPSYVKDLMKRFNDNFTEKEIKQFLTGNNHNLSEKSQLREKLEYENSESFEEYLVGRHKRKVNELKDYMQNNQIWFEQKITQEVINYVEGNQEILSGKLINDKLYITKIPYDTNAFINAFDPIEKRYYACHCPFVRESIISRSDDIDEKFCYCSAGFAKFPFEVILNQKLGIKCIETVLGGSEICRFEIDMSNVDYKRKKS